MANKILYKEKTFHSGDVIKVYEKIVEGDKTRLIPFEGTVIKIRGRQENKSFTVRKIAVGGIWVERVWPLLCPSIEKIEVKKKGRVRRAKLYYLRSKRSKKDLKIKQKA